jgi:transposase-like protein
MVFISKAKRAYIMMNGEKSVIRAIRQVWCDVKIQRCLYHIQWEGMRWLLSYPKSVAGKELRSILRTLSAIKSIDEKETFIDAFEKWLDKHKDFIASLPRNEIASKDLRKTITLISNALPDMFYCLRDANVHYEYIGRFFLSFEG